MSRLKRADQDTFCLGKREVEGRDVEGRDVEGERNLNGCESLAPHRNLEHVETKAAFKGCSQQCQALWGQEEEEEVTRPWCRIFCHSCWPAGGGQDVWSRLIPAHRCGAAPLGAFLWHGPTAGSTGPSNALLLLCVFVGSSWSPNVENEFWESYLRFLEAAALPACLWWLLEYPGQGGFASPALGKIWQELIMASVGRWFLTWSSAELVTPSAQSSEGWQGKVISQHLNSCSLFLISLRDNSNGWIETGPDSQDRK